MPVFSSSPVHRPAARLEGRSALVTGAASGVGLEVVRVLRDEGARVFAADVDGARLAAAGVTSASVSVHLLDVRSEHECRTIVAAALAEAGGAIDVVVNSAGATVRGTIEETTSELFAGTLDLNLTSVVRLCRLTVPAMRRQGRGSIINVASITSTEGMSGTVAYTASKGGLTAMTRALAVELAPSGVRVNAVSPSVVDSPMTHDHVRTLPDSAAHYQELLRRQPMGRMASPRDVALATLFLASDESAFITGANIPVDGGRHAT